MSIPHQLKKLFIFQSVNIVVSIFVWFLFPLSISGFNVAYPLFSLKVIALIWFNEYPYERSLYSMIFFVLACVDVFTIFLFGSFSIFSWGFARLF